MAEPPNRAGSSPNGMNAEETPTSVAATALVPSLFPVFTVPYSSAQSTSLIQSFSFTPDLAAVNDAVSSRYGNASIVSEEDSDANESEEDDKKNGLNHKAPTSYEFVQSSESDGGGDRKRTDKKKKNKRKRKKTAAEDIHPMPFTRGHGAYTVRAGADSEAKPAKDYYVDPRGDPDNLAFGSLYRMEVPRYKLHNPSLHSEANLRAYYLSDARGLLPKEESDVNALDSHLKSNGRYWSAKYSALERHTNFKRMRIVGPEKQFHDPSVEFIPLPAQDVKCDDFQEPTMLEESWEDEVLRRTKDFNKMTRENPHNTEFWLEFAEFQDKVASRQTRKGARLQTLEKKISILEKAVELNPEDEDLLLYLLKAYQGRDTTDTLIVQWEKILMQHPESSKLWKEFMHVLQSEFSKFKVSELRKMYGHAIQALSAAVTNKRIRQVQGKIDLRPAENSVIEIELGVVDIFVSLCRFEWQTGYRELSTALFQAEIEYSLFAPSLQFSEHSKKRLFEHFWNSTGARVGEDGALGWSTWMEKEEEQRQKVANEASLKEEEEGGWTGWFIPEDKENAAASVNNIEIDVDMQDGGEEGNKEDINNADDFALLKRLGIDVDAEATCEVKDTTTWARWSKVESARDVDQWMPIRSQSEPSYNDEAVEGEDEEQLSRVILFEDVEEYLFSLSSAEARISLVSQFVDFFGGDVSDCICTNTSGWSDRLLNSEDLPGFILEELKKVHNSLTSVQSSSSEPSVELLLQGQDKMLRRKDIIIFLRNAILLILTIFPRNFKLQKAVLIAEEQFVLGDDISGGLTTPCQGLAKRLLKSDRQDVLLCAVYAQREAAFGNVAHARRVFDMALSSINGLTQEIQSRASMLYLWYSEMELAIGSSVGSDSLFRALHILSCLGSGISYSPYTCQPSSMQLLRAHQGFKERVKAIQSAWACGVLDQSSVAFICSAALFEEFATGWTSGVKVLSESLAVVLTEKKSISQYLEHLFMYHVKMLMKHHHQAKLSAVLHPILQGLEIYPFNMELFQSLVQLSHLYSVPNKLRQIFDAHFQKKSSVVVWLFAMSYELSRNGTQHRIRGLFERALANDQLRASAFIWRCYVAYQTDVVGDLVAAKRIYFRAIHACPWSKQLWLDGFSRLSSILTAKELSDLQEVMRDKELNLRTDIYEILLQDEFEQGKAHV